MISAPNWRALIDRLKLRKRAYEQIILGPPGTASHEFLTDLANFCRPFDHSPARKRDGSIDADLELIRVGQRMVWDRIAQHLRLEPEQLAQIYGATVARQLGETP